MNEPNDSLFLKLLPYISSLVLGGVTAWGTAQYLSGQTQQRLLVLESTVQEMKARQNEDVSRSEVKVMMDNQNAILSDIRLDIRELRKERDGSTRR